MTYQLRYRLELRPQLRSALALLTDANEIQQLSRNFTGTFQTGDNPGDRAIVIAADGTVRFIEFATRNRQTESRDTYQIGRHAGKLCFSTTDNGVVEVSNPDALIYYRDIYRRVKR